MVRTAGTNSTSSFNCKFNGFYIFYSVIENKLKNLMHPGPIWGQKIVALLIKNKIWASCNGDLICRQIVANMYHKNKIILLWAIIYHKKMWTRQKIQNNLWMRELKGNRCYRLYWNARRKYYLCIRNYKNCMTHFMLTDKL